MNGRNKILSAFGKTGTPEFGAVVCYDFLFLRDHWSSLTSVPWYYMTSGIVDKETAWARDVIESTGLDWLAAFKCRSHEERLRFIYEQREDGAFLIDTETGKKTALLQPASGGTDTECAYSKHLKSLPATEQEIDALIPLDGVFNREQFQKEGRHEAAITIRDTLNVCTWGHTSSPIWQLYSLLGYEGMMLLPLQDSGLTMYAGKRFVENTKQSIQYYSALGTDAIWIEDCLSDQVSPELYHRLYIPLVRECVNEIRTTGMKSIYYYCGNPNDRLDAILEIGADAVHFEESKKGFTIDIADIVKKVNGRCVVFGNLDAIGVLQDGSEDELRSEIRRQIEAGRNNGSRFVMSTGSPVTPQTSVERLRLYTDLMRELGA